MGLTTFVAVAEAGLIAQNDSQPFDLSNPGYMGTILAPTDDAWASWFFSQGRDADDLLQDAQLMRELAEFHVLEPIRDLRASWTSPFMFEGQWLRSLLKGAGYRSTRFAGDLRVYQEDAPFGSATVLERDRLSCKAVIMSIDKVLTPPSWAISGGASRLESRPTVLSGSQPISGAIATIASQAPVEGPVSGFGTSSVVSLQG